MHDSKGVKCGEEHQTCLGIGRMVETQNLMMMQFITASRKHVTKTILSDMRENVSGIGRNLNL